MELHLIEMVKKRPCLWNTECEEYKLFDSKVQAWNEVVKECNLTDVKEARIVWKRLRDSHRQVITRKVSGQVVRPTSTWKYEKQMEFLLPSMRIGVRKTQYTESIEDEEENGEETQNNEDSLGSDEHQNTINTFISNKRESIRLEKDQRRKETRSFEIDGQRLHEENSPKSVQESALEKFFTSMFLTTSQLPEVIQLRLQREIFEKVMTAKEEWLNSFGSQADPLTAPDIKDWH